MLSNLSPLRIECLHLQTIFVFNIYYLDTDTDEVAKLLHLQPPL